MTEELYGRDLEVAARAIATVAHAGQVDKAGNPYIEHPARVAARVADHVEDAAVAWLHDVLEDTDVTVEVLRAAGISTGIIHDVELLTRKPDQQPEDYYAMVRQSFRARRVKLADIEDNSDIERLALLDDQTMSRLIRKYAKARLLLSVRSAGETT